MPAQERVTIKIPKPLYSKIRKVIEGSSYNSVTDFVIYVLRDVIAAEKGKEKSIGLTKREIALIKQRLKNLGYL